MHVRNAAKHAWRPRVSGMLRLLPPPPLLLGVHRRAPPLLVRARILRELQPLALLLQGLHAQDLKHVPGAKLCNVEILPRP